VELGRKEIVLLQITSEKGGGVIKYCCHKGIGGGGKLFEEVHTKLARVVA